MSSEVLLRSYPEVFCSSGLALSACLGVKNIGKPCAGKPHARFDEGGQARAYISTLPMHLVQDSRIHRATEGTRPPVRINSR